MNRNHQHDLTTKTLRRVMLVVALVMLLQAAIFCFVLYHTQMDHYFDRLMNLAMALADALDERSIGLLATVSSLPPTEQLAAAHAALQPLIDHFAEHNPGFGLGFYCKQLDSIVATFPYDASFLRPVAADSPYMRSYITGRPERVLARTSLTWAGLPLAAATYPISRNGVVLGHTWANNKLGDVYLGIGKALAVLLGLYGLVAVAIWRLLRGHFEGLRSGIKQISLAAIAGQASAGQTMPELQELVQSLRASRSVSERVIEQSVDMICTTDREARLLSVNPAGERMLGYPADELLHRPVSEFIAAEDQAKYRQGGRMLTSSQVISNWELRLQQRDGSVRTTTWSCYPDRDAGIIYCTARDVTEFRLLQQQVVRLDRLDLAGQMAAAISHEVRNPLTTVRGYLQLMRRNSQTATESDRLGLMIEELDRANGIITEFLALAKPQSDDRNQVTLGTIIERVAPLIEADCLLRGCSLELCLAETARLELDEKEIRQLLLNLARNGLDAMPNGGRLTITTTGTEAEVRLTVTDQGSGIPPAALERIWDPFFTTKSSGTGLGLAVCHRIANNHNGHIWVDQTGPTGTTIVVRFAR